MHAIKVSWVGQTFALAKCSDSGGRKSRIRRTKEERKAMVESFIKKYQNANNGNFPSLNLTHKEVGGSFYTVREIVREVIQENRVLGPAKLTSEGHNSNQFSEQYPLGSISIEPQGHLSISSTESGFVPNNHQTFSEGLVSTLNVQSTGHKQQSFDNGRYIKGNWMDEEYESNVRKSLEQDGVMTQMDDEPTCTEVQVSKRLDVVKDVGEASTAKVTPIAAGIIVETFPLKSAAKPTHSMESGEAREITRTLEELETNKVEMATINNNSVVHRMDSLEKNSTSSVDEKAAAYIEEPLWENLSDSTTGQSTTGGLLESTNLLVDISQRNVLTSQTSDQNQEVAGTEPEVAPDEVQIKNGIASNSGSTGEESLSQEAVVIKTKAETEHSQSIEEGSNSTLNRINLESWEGASKKTAEAETNPFWTVFKAFLTAFVKFWSE